MTLQYLIQLLSIFIHQILGQMNWGYASGLRKLADLSVKIRSWNMMGQSLLPEIELVILMNEKYFDVIKQLIHDMDANKIVLNNTQVVQNQSNEINIQPKQDESKLTKIDRWLKDKSIYQIYRMNNEIKGNIHIIKGLSDAQIKDAEFRERKILIDKFNRNKDAIFIVFDVLQYNSLMRNQQCLSQFGLIQHSNKLILYTINSSTQQLYNMILFKYEDIFKFQLVRNYKIMRETLKSVEKDLNRFVQWKKLLDKEIDPISYSLLMHKMYTDTMKSSFSGTYSCDISFEAIGLGKSIHWKISELLTAFWEIQSDMLFKSVDSMSLAYIQQQYKMSDYYSIGGFLPDTCFKQIFSPPLYSLQKSLIGTLQIILSYIINHVQQALNYIFKNTSILDTYTEQQLGRIQEEICNKFEKEFQLSLQSQIEYIYATPQQFWNYRQLNTSLYSPEQQIYLEIKYIGKAYVRRVYERLRENIPRMIGQNLLKKVVGYLSNQSFNTFINVAHEIDFQITIPEYELINYQIKMKKLEQLGKLVTFFSLKVSSPIFIKNFHEKKKKDWDRMFGIENKSPEPRKPQHHAEQGGIIAWMKNIFGKKAPDDNTRKRSNSAQKKTQKVLMEEQNPPPQLHQKRGLNQKQWLLIINTGKQVDFHKIIQSAIEGFPSRMRSSIWMYLASKSKTYSEHQKLIKVLQRGVVKQETYRQIQKDILRTPPANIFKYSLRQSLSRVLEGYSIVDQQVGYTQGMNFLAGILLLTLTNFEEKQSHLTENIINYREVEEKAFILLKFLMKQKGVKRIMLVTQQIISQISMRLQSRIKQLSNNVYQAIERSTFTCQMIFSSPIISCLSGTQMEYKIHKRVMDLLFTHDIYIIYKIIAQFAAASEETVCKIDTDSLYGYLRTKMFGQVYHIIGDQGLTILFQDL